jgi:hypothetical protein
MTVGYALEFSYSLVERRAENVSATMVLYYSCNCRADQIRKPPANHTHDGNKQCPTKIAGVAGPTIHAMPGSD